jgi:hypothetical protein
MKKKPIVCTRKLAVHAHYMHTFFTVQTKGFESKSTSSRQELTLFKKTRTAIISFGLSSSQFNPVISVISVRQKMPMTHETDKPINYKILLIISLKIGGGIIGGAKISGNCLPLGPASIGGETANGGSIGAGPIGIGGGAVLTTSPVGA